MKGEDKWIIHKGECETEKKKSRSYNKRRFIAFSNTQNERKIFNAESAT